jgi:hypothetical protein
VCDVQPAYNHNQTEQLACFHPKGAATLGDSLLVQLVTQRRICKSGKGEFERVVIVVEPARASKIARWLAIPGIQE